MSEIDFAIGEFPDLYELLEQLRQQAPVVQVNFAGVPTWLVLGNAEVRQVIGDDEFLSAPAAYKRLLEPSMGEVLPTMTGARHRQNRAAVASVFFPRRMRELAETVFADEARQLVEGFTANQALDLVSHYTRHFTFNNITRLLGLPAADSPRLHDWADRIMHSYIDLPAAISACEDMGEYLGPIVAARRAKPAQDMISLLLETEVEGVALSDAEIFAFCRNLFPAAIDTSTNTLGSLLAVVLGDPALREIARGGGKPLEGLVQEVLRWEPALVMVPRECVRSFELGGARINQGDQVRLCIAGANSDPAVYTRPREFDYTRSGSHLAFGHGEHFCLGSHMARRVVETGVQVLLEHFPDTRLDPGHEVAICGGVLRGPRELWAVLS